MSKSRAPCLFPFLRPGRGADATGLTSVHVNRMLRALERDGAITRDRREIRISDWSAMRRIADFDAAYLHAA